VEWLEIKTKHYNINIIKKNKYKKVISQRIRTLKGVVIRQIIVCWMYRTYIGLVNRDRAKGSFNKDARSLNINKTSCVWDIHSILFLFERTFYGIKYGI